MAVSKVNGFNAPYRSLTFQNTALGLAQRDGVLKIAGPITVAAGAITIPALTFLQAGLVVQDTGPRVLTIPTELTAPYFITVHAPDSRAVDNLIYAFAKSPQDMGTGVVPIARFDGNEWQTLPLISLDALINALEQQRVDDNETGVQSGLKATLVGSTYEVSPGILIDRTGERVEIKTEHDFARVGQDPDFKRVDRLVYRRPVDDVKRVGQIEYLIGNTYGAVPGPLYVNSFGDPSTPPQGIKTLIAADNRAFVLYSQGYGDQFSIVLNVVSSDRTTNVETTAITDATEAGFDAVIDSTGNIQIVYVKNGTIQLVSVDSTGAVVHAATDITVVAVPASNPQITIDDQDLLYIVFQGLEGPINNQLFFTTRTLVAALVTSPLRLQNDASNYINPSIVVTRDYLVYIAYEDAQLGKVYYEARTQFGTPYVTQSYLSGATASGSGTLVDQARLAKIVMTNSQELYVVFLQKMSGNYQVVVWSLSTGAAVNPFVPPSVSVDAISVCADQVSNYLHVTAAAANSTEPTYALIDPKTSPAIFSDNLSSGTGWNLVSSARDNLGSMYHAYGLFVAGTYNTYQTGQLLAYVGPATVIGTAGTVGVDADQFLMSSLRPEPRVGDQLTIANSPTNNGIYIVKAVQPVTVNATDDFWLVQVDSAFVGSENPVLSTTADYAAPVGNTMSSCKTASMTLSAPAYSLDVPTTDVLITRIDNGHILNTLVGQPFNTDRLGVVAGTRIDWSKTTIDEFTMSDPMLIWDLVSNVTYTLAAAGYAMQEGDALCVQLDGSHLTPTPIVVPIIDIPHGDNYIVLGFRQDDVFCPVFLTKGDVNPLMAGEADTTGQDLPDSIRAKLGITGDTTFEPFASVTVIAQTDTMPEAVSKLDARSDLQTELIRQNRNLTLIEGGNWNWNLGTTTLAWDAVGYIDVPGVPRAANQIQIDSVTLAADGDVAYVQINRTDPGTPTSLVISTTDITSFDLLTSADVAKDDYILIARREGNAVLVGDVMRLIDGETKVLRMGLSSQSLSLLGVTDESVSSYKLVSSRAAPGRFLHEDDSTGDALAEIDTELDKLFGQCRMKPSTTPDTNVTVTGSDYQMRTGETIKLELDGEMVIFDGAIIDFLNGDVYLTDDVTEIGDAFEGASDMDPGTFRWYSIALVRSSESTDFASNCKISIQKGFQDGASADLARKPSFTNGRRLGYVLVQCDGTGTVLPIDYTSLYPIFNGVDPTANGEGGSGSGLIGGGIWSWDGDFLNNTATSWIQVPGFVDTRNRINTLSNYELPFDHYVLFAEMNTTTGPNAFVSVQADFIYNVERKDNTVIIARRVGNTVIVGGTTLLVPNSSKRLGQGMSEQNRQAIGLVDEADSTPIYSSAWPDSEGNTWVGDGDPLNSAIKKLDMAVNQGCRLIANSTDARVSITSADVPLPDGSIGSRPLAALKVAFDGAVVDFNTGIIYKADGITPLGINFTVAPLAIGQYRWYSIVLVGGVTNAVNEITCQILVQAGTGTGSSPALAPKPSFAPNAINLGMVVTSYGGTATNPIAQTDIIVVSAAGTGGSETGAVNVVVEPATGYQYVEYDAFDVPATDSSSTVDTSRTNGQYSVTGLLYQLSCDKSKTITTSGTSFTLSSAPNFTIKAGDIIWANAQAKWRRIVSITSQTQGILDAAFPAPLTAAAGMVSQAVWTKDIVNMGDAAQATRVADMYPGLSITEINLYYEDSVAAGDAVADLTAPARLIAAAAPLGLDGDVTLPNSTDFSSIFRRAQAPGEILDYGQDNADVNKQRLFLIFFPDPTNATVTTQANLLYFDVSLYPTSSLTSGGILYSAYGFTNDGAASSQNNLSVGTNTDTMTGKSITTTIGLDVVTVSPDTTSIEDAQNYDVPQTVNCASLLPAGTVVLKVLNGTQIQISQPASASGGPTAASFSKTVTEITLGYSYIPGLLSGLPDGDNEVILAGEIIPRYYAGVKGTYYKEVTNSVNKLWISADYTPYAYSIMARRRQGSIDSVDSNRLQMTALYDVIVGSAAQVTQGQAQYSSIQAAHDSMTGAGRMLILANTYVGDVVWVKNNIKVEAKGRGVILNGNFSVSAQGLDLDSLKVTGNVNLTGSNYCFIKLWMLATSTFTAGGIANSVNVIQE